MKEKDLIEMIHEFILIFQFSHFIFIGDLENKDSSVKVRTSN